MEHLKIATDNYVAFTFLSEQWQRRQHQFFSFLNQTVRSRNGEPMFFYKISHPFNLK